MIELELQVRPWERAMNSLVKDQLPIATADALTSVAYAAQSRVRLELTRRFTIRNRGLLKGVQVVKAKKRDWPRSRAIVGMREALWAPHETGALVRPYRSKHHAIPTRRVKRNKGGTVRKSQRPSEIIQRGRGHVAGSIIRLNDHRRRTRRSATMYLLRKSIRIRPSLRFEETVRGVALRQLQPAFHAKLKAHLRTARPR
ncbi:MAG: hypothetical protein AAFU73_23455 [Planctomycetota bacterium]